MIERKDILIFYNKSTGKKIGYYSIYAGIVEHISLAEIFHDNYLKIDVVLDDLYCNTITYFFNLKKQLVDTKIKRTDIQTKYVDLDTYLRKNKINNIKKNINKNERF